MTRTELDQYLKRTYNASPERLFPKYPSFAIYRHQKGRKWFAVIMELAPKTLGLDGTEPITVINLKVDPILCDILRAKEGFFPAYHMNKENWITVQISEKTDNDELYILLAMSFRLTKTKLDQI